MQMSLRIYRGAMNAMKSLGRILLIHLLWGLWFGAANNIINICVFYIVPEFPLGNLVKLILTAMVYPVTYFIFLFWPNGNLIVVFMVQIMAVFIQWMLIGLAIGYWRYRMLRKNH